MGFSPRLLLKSSFRNSTNSDNGRRTASPSTSNGSPTPGSWRNPPVNALNASSSFSSVRSGISYASNSSVNDPSKTKAASEVLSIVAEQKLCVVRKYGAQEETLVSSIVDGLGKIAGVIPLYLTVSQQTACQLLDLVDRTGLPLIFVNGNAVGGLSELLALEKSKFIDEALKSHDYDLAVIGGGPAGLVAAQEASILGKKVICVDFRPNLQKMNNSNETCQLGGFSTICGLAPKQMLCESANLWQKLQNAEKWGFELGTDSQLNWAKLRSSIDAELARISEQYHTQLKQAQVEYLNGKAVFTGSHEITVTDLTGRHRKINADKFLIAVGQHAQYPHILNAEELCITGEEFLAALKDPKKTLCTGDSILSFEIAGILRAFGIDVTILSQNMISECLDKELIERLRTNLIENGVKFQTGIINGVERAGEDLIYVTMERQKANGGIEKFEETFNTVILATENVATNLLKDINIQKFGVKLTKDSSRLETRADQCIGSMPNAYAIGGCAHYFPESTPAASSQTAITLIKRLYSGCIELENFNPIPTTILLANTQYAFCGLTEEIAIKKFSSENISIYKKCFGESAQNFCKIICLKYEQDRILGVHIVAFNAKSLIESIAVALKLDARKAHLDNLIGISDTFNQMFKNLTLYERYSNKFFA